MNSRQKGARGERELASKLREYGYEARRGQQYNGADGSADVLGLPGIHIECKRVERLNLEDAMSQSKRDAREGEIPTVMHRKNNCKWLVTLDLEDFMKLYNEYFVSDYVPMPEVVKNEIVKKAFIERIAKPIKEGD